MNRTICNDAYGNIISNAHDRNLSAPSLNYETNLNYKKILNKKKKKNNIIGLYKGDKKVLDENLINKDNYAYHMRLDNNSINDKNNFERNNNNMMTLITYNRDYQATNNNLNNCNKSGEFDQLIKVKTLEKEEDIYENIQNNNLNIKNFYKNINKNKRKNYINVNPKNDLSIFIKDIEAIQNKREKIALLKEQLKAKDKKCKIDNKKKINKTQNLNSINSNQANSIFENMNNYKNNNMINLVNKSGYVTSNFHNYNKYVLNKKNKNKKINKTNNNTCYNDTSNVSKDLTPNKKTSITAKGNINLSNSSKDKTITNSTNITNNNNILEKKIDLTNIYGGKKHKEENNLKENNILKEKEEEKLINNLKEENIEPINNKINGINKFYTEKNFDANNILLSGNLYDDEAFSYKSNDINTQINDRSDFLDKNDNIISNNNKINLDNNNKKTNNSFFQNPDKSSNIQTKETAPFSLNAKNKKNTNANNKIKEKKDNKSINNKKKNK